MTRRRVVITGLGTVNAAGNDVPTSWGRVCDGNSGITRVTRFDVTGYPSQIAGEVKDLDTEGILGRKVVRRLGTFMQYGLVASIEAMKDAGLGDGDMDRDRLGVYVGSGIGGFNEIVEEAYLLQQYGIRRVSAFFVPRALINLATGQIAIHFGARGPSIVNSTACAASNHSIGEAWRAIRDGDADVIIAGGTEAIISPLTFGGFMSMKATSTRNDDPATASRPFDRDRDGFVIAEGAGIVVLEELDHARRRGARIYAEVAGYGATTDAHHITAPTPDGDGAARCMARALYSGGIAPNEVDYVNAHGTSTELNDITETMAIRRVFGDHADHLAVSSIKGVMGHALGAAGGIEAIMTALTVHTGVIPPTANHFLAGHGCDLDYVAEGCRRIGVRVAISNGFGFGGTNATLVMRRWEEG